LLRRDDMLHFFDLSLKQTLLFAEDSFQLLLSAMPDQLRVVKS
jgi:hypothetical protein